MAEFLAGLAANLALQATLCRDADHACARRRMAREFVSHFVPNGERASVIGSQYGFPFH
ncbi:hypothetical protein [Bradyrhizobium sp.]|jgi:hypothetical protein|uniref:hypothetical protein n=1 Tax=Bradyrhizobium sp. TaxID=376 RepID=UPI002DDD89ED|nr:hypothetical protein [Bradyrhizobium sp.]HEV2158119.1 hypothetical protein [Bradyrhizobium sp.]